MENQSADNSKIKKNTIKTVQLIEDSHELGIYPKRDIVIIKGENAKLWDENGVEYIDCVAGIGVANFGHSNKIIVDAIQEQAKKLITCPEIFYNNTRAKLLQKLIKISPKNLTKAFLCNSGTETIEAAIKFARYTTKKTNFVSAMRGFHGRSLGSLSATFNKKYRLDFEPLVPGFNFVPFNNFDKLRAVVDENTAGIILEVVQGEGGIHVGSKEYFRQVRNLCDEMGILLIIDEVQTGFARTGKIFACNHFNLEPDILCIAKSIAGGLPMGAVLCSDKITIGKNKHGSTFGGNPLSCAASIAAIDYMIDHDVAKQAFEKGEYFQNKFNSKDIKVIRQVRNLGLMIGIELKTKAMPYIKTLMSKGILVLPAGTTVIRLLPPLTISYQELDTVIEALIDVFN